MSDDLREDDGARHPEDGAVERLPADLEAIFDQLAHDSEGWARRLPEASSLQEYARAMATGTAPVHATAPTDGMRSRDAESRSSSVYLPTPQTHPSRRAVWAGAIAAVAIVALLSSVFALIPRTRGTGQPVSATATATPQPPSCPADQITLNVPPYSEFNKLEMTSPTDGWIIGDTRNTTTWLDNPDPLVVHFHDCRWETIPSPVPGVTAYLRDISLDTAGDGWAVGTEGDSTQGFDIVHCLLLHYAGGRWQRAPTPSALPNGYSSCNTIAMLSPEEGWMLASWGTQEVPGASNHLLHYTAGAWTPVHMPIIGTYALSVVGPDNVWVAGMRPPAATDPTNSFMRVDMAHYQRGQWTTFHLEADAEASFNMNSPSDGWLVSASLPPLVMHYDGTSWQPSAFSDHAPSSFGGITVLDNDDAWAETENDHGPQSTLTSIQHYVGGQWQDVAWPFPHTGILSPIMRVAPGDYWAFGEHVYNADSSVWQTVLMHYVDGAWHEYGA